MMTNTSRKIIDNLYVTVITILIELFTFMFTLIVIYSFYKGLLFSAINEYFGDKTLNNYINIDGHSSQWFIMVLGNMFSYISSSI